MKTKEEIRKLGLDSCDTWSEHCAFVEGYIQCQEDMAKEINKQIYDFTIDLKESTSTYVKQNCEGAIFGLERLLNSINKQD
jgi:hypothetical protein